MYYPPSTYANQVDFTFFIILAFSLLTLIGITFAMLYFVIKYDKKRNPVADNISQNTTLEIIWIVIPTIIALGFFWYGYIGFVNLRTVPSNAMKINVVARMWSWNFKYPNGKKSDELYVPINKPIKLLITSLDVNHSLYIPSFRIKEDAVPGKETYLWFQPDILGAYTIYCSEYCGEGHSKMITKLHVVSSKDFDSWYKSTKEKKTTSLEPTGLSLMKKNGCLTCHSIENDSIIIGPPLNNIFGRKTIILTNGKEKTIIADENYLKKSLIDPKVDVVKGFQAIMPSSSGVLSDNDIKAIIEYLKTSSKKNDGVIKP